jgi:hypothetical protein
MTDKALIGQIVARAAEDYAAPVCASCGKTMCPCVASIPADRRFCLACRVQGLHRPLGLHHKPPDQMRE